MTIFICNLCKCKIRSNKNIYCAYDYNYCSNECRIKYLTKNNSLKQTNCLIETDETDEKDKSKAIIEIHEIKNNTNELNVIIYPDNTLNSQHIKYKYQKIKSNKTISDLTELEDSREKKNNNNNFRDCNSYINYSLSLLLFIVNTFYVTK